MPQGFLHDPDEFVHQGVASARAAVERRVEEVTLYTQREPQKALVAAAVTGFLLHLLPLRALARLVVGLLFFALKPSLLLYGGARLWSSMKTATPAGAPAKARGRKSQLAA